MKFASLPKKIPIGATQAMMSRKKKVLIFFFLEKIYVPHPFIIETIDMFKNQDYKK